MSGQLTQYYRDLGLTHLHAKIISRNVTGGISLAGNILILQDILRNPNKLAQNSIYHRLMIGLSVTEFFTSLGIFLGTWPMPKGYFIMAVGSIRSCDATGFFNQVGAIGTPLYNCSLVVNYFLRLKCLWPERKVKEIEKWLHIVPLSVTFISAIVGLILRAYGPIGLHCWITDAYPIHCDNDDSDVECLRGKPSTLRIFFSVYIIIQILSILFVAITMYITFRTILKTERASDRFSFTSFRLANETRYRNRAMSRRVFLQGILYSLVLILVSAFIIANFLHHQITGRISNTLQLITGFFTPLRGCFNMLIYFIPEFEKRIEERKKKKKRKILEEIASAANNIPSPNPAPSTKRRRRVSFADLCDVDPDIDVDVDVDPDIDVEVDVDQHNDDSKNSKESTAKVSKSSEVESSGLVKNLRDYNDEEINVILNDDSKLDQLITENLMFNSKRREDFYKEKQEEREEMRQCYMKGMEP